MEGLRAETAQAEELAIIPPVCARVSLDSLEGNARASRLNLYRKCVAKVTKLVGPENCLTDHDVYKS